MNTKNIRPKLLSFIAVLTIIGGIIGTIRSLPLYSLYNSIKQGGVVVEDKVRIIEVQPNTPAANTGLQPGDSIISVNNKTITSSSDFVEIINANKGKEVTITVERESQILTVQLVPRVNPPPNEGNIGVLLTDTKIKEVPLYQLIPQVIIRGYSGYEEAPTLFFSLYSYQDKSYARLKLLISAIIGVVVGIGLWRLRKWAIYGFLLLTAYALIASLPYLINPESYSINQPQSLFLPHLNKPTLTDTLIYIVGLSIEILLAVYIFSKKKLFE